MNVLVESGIIKELIFNFDFTYVLQDGNVAITSDYKILKKGWDDYFVPCMNVKTNGRDALYYYVGEFKPLSILEYSLSQEQLLRIIKNIIKNIVDVRNNGFLSCQKIEFSNDKIFIDPKSLRTVLTYVPLNKKLNSDEIAFEDCVRRNLIDLVADSEQIDQDTKNLLISALKNVMVSLDTIIEKLPSMDKGYLSEDVDTFIKDDTVFDSSPSYKLVSINAPTHLQFTIDKTDYLLGRKKAVVDGAIEYNKMIGRVHCRLSIVEGKLMVQDLDSANGTYVNGVKLKSNNPKILNVGDILKLADTELKVII